MTDTSNTRIALLDLLLPMSYTVVNEALLTTRSDTGSLRVALEKGADDDKIRAMKEILSLTLAKESMPSLLMDIIRFVLPSKNKQLKKLLHAYWEVVPKHDDQGKLRHEMILVVNAIRNDLQHPNEFVRGSTLRLLAKFTDIELLDPLVPTIRQCLEHRHAYVRKNAVFCILGIAENEVTAHLIPDASELLFAFINAENDATCQRNAFVALARLDRTPAYTFFHGVYANISAADETLQLALIDFAAKDAIETPELTDMYVQILANWLTQAPEMSTSVRYETANALAHLTGDREVLTTVGAAYIDIAVKESDTSVKITALNRVSDLADDDSLSSLVMDVLLVLPTQDIAVRKTALDLALKLVSNRTVEQVLRLLKKELANSIGQQYDSADEYRHAIVDTIDNIALRFKEFAGEVVGLLLEFIGELSSASALEVMTFVKEFLELHTEKRESIVTQLVESLPSIHSSRAYLSALWVLGEYSLTESEIELSWSALREAIGTVPFDAAESEKEESGSAHVSTKPKVLADGTYATESPLEVAAAAAAAEQDNSHQLRKLLLGGDTFLAGAFAATLTKLAIRYGRLSGADKAKSNKLKAEAMLIIASLLRTQSAKFNDDAFDRLYGCINLLVQGSHEAQTEFLEKPHEAFAELQRRVNKNKAKINVAVAEKNAIRIEQPVEFRLFSKIDGSSRATKAASKPKKKADIVTNVNQSQLKQVTQLTGYTDPVYAEALITITQFDVVLEVLVFNQTSETLQNLKVSFYATGDLKVSNSAAAANVAPMSFHTARVSVRVSSLDSAMIFGDITYDGKDSLQVILLNEIRLNVIDYIRPTPYSDEKFRSNWVKFEWENKVPINKETNDSLAGFLQSFLQRTNMYCLSEGVEDTKSNFLSANFHARSTFGETILANMSVEKTEGSIVGYVRIRASKKGAVISIGDCLEGF